MYVFIFPQQSIALVSLLLRKSNFSLEELWPHVVQNTYKSERRQYALGLFC